MQSHTACSITGRTPNIISSFIAQTMSKVVLTNEDEQNRAIASGGGGSRPASTTTDQRPSRILGPEPFDSENLPIAFVSGPVQRFLRVANQIEIHEPRVAYVCRFHAFEEAHKLDPSSSGRGVRQFKHSLLQRLAQDQEATITKTNKNSDSRELMRVYREYKDIASVLYEIICYDGRRGMPVEED